jgi:phosphoglycolate phosphatase-like HAD superfamily hydrolase
VTTYSFLPGTSIEIINPNIERGKINSALFDFDGTLSLIREGWQNVMVPMFVGYLKETCTSETEEELTEVVREFVMRLTGKQTIYQMFELEEQIKKRGGTPKEALEYKHIYLDLLWERIHNRVDGLKSGSESPNDHIVLGSYELLDALKANGCQLYMASGTDLPYVKSETEVLQMTHYFGEHIYGALDEYKNFSKKKIINLLMKENNLSGPQLLTFGDGYVEIENTKEVGGIAVGVASDEEGKIEIDQWKRTRLIDAGADIIIPNYTETPALIDYLFPGN